MDLNGKNLIYIGGFGGIGRHCIREFLQKGIKNVVIFDLFENQAILSDLRKDFPTANIIYIFLDIIRKNNIIDAYKEAKEKIGHFDVVVNGSGLIDDREVELTIRINLLGLIQSTLTAVEYMSKLNGGRGGLIVNISSVAGIEPTALLAVYSAAKFGVTGFTRALAHPIYYEQTGVGFITICPGFTDTSLLDDMVNRTTYTFHTKMSDQFPKAKRQQPDVCARNLVKAVESGKNGSVWMLDLNEMKEMEFPVNWQPTF